MTEIIDKKTYTIYTLKKDFEVGAEVVQRFRDPLAIILLQWRLM